MDRRRFIQSSAAAAVALGLAPLDADAGKIKRSGKIRSVPQSVKAPDGGIKAFLMHLGYNMWGDWPTGQMGSTLEEAVLQLPEKQRPNLELKCEDQAWRLISDHAARNGVNMIVVDLGEGVRLPSHPELSVPGSWSVEKMQQEIARLNSMGIEVIPKMNFSTQHNAWLKDYRHMLSSSIYYSLCEDIISDAYEIFGHPRFFHIGYDEETAELQSKRLYRIQRVGNAWWCDFLHIVRTVENLGARPIMWSDFAWYNDDFTERCPKSVIQQNWFYDDLDKVNHNSLKLKLFKRLDEAGFDQIPCGSNWSCAENSKGLVKFCDGVISTEHLMGYMMAPWGGTTTMENKDNYIQGLDLFNDAMK